MPKPILSRSVRRSARTGSSGRVRPFGPFLEAGLDLLGENVGLALAANLPTGNRRTRVTSAIPSARRRHRASARDSRPKACATRQARRGARGRRTYRAARHSRARARSAASPIRASPISSVRWARGANVPKGSASHAPDPAVPGPTTRMCGCCSRTVTIAALSPSSILGSELSVSAARCGVLRLDFGHGSLGGKSRRQREHLRFVGDFAAPDILDRRQHAAVCARAPRRRARREGGSDKRSERRGEARGQVLTPRSSGFSAQSVMKAAAVERLMPAQQWIRSGALRSQSRANLTRCETWVSQGSTRPSCGSQMSFMASLRCRSGPIEGGVSMSVSPLISVTRWLTLASATVLCTRLKGAT